MRSCKILPAILVLSAIPAVATAQEPPLTPPSNRWLQPPSNR